MLFPVKALPKQLRWSPFVANELPSLSHQFHKSPAPNHSIPLYLSECVGNCPSKFFPLPSFRSPFLQKFRLFLLLPCFLGLKKQDLRLVDWMTDRFMSICTECMMHCMTLSCGGKVPLSSVFAPLWVLWKTISHQPWTWQSPSLAVISSFFFFFSMNLDQFAGLLRDLAGINWGPNLLCLQSFW